MKIDDIQELIHGIVRGDHVALGRTITLIESTNADHQKTAIDILSSCSSSNREAIRIGITGAPGVGKSTFIEAFGSKLVEKGYKIAVLTIDPSSVLSGGSILGDKTRMQKLSKSPQAFIRPSPSGLNLGGVASGTYDSILLLEAAGFDYILIETVGVGQSETDISNISDVVLLLINPVSGDALQGIKRGIMETADLIFINKSDGDLLQKAKLKRKALEQAIHLQIPKESFWTVPVILGSSLISVGTESIADQLFEYIDKSKSNGNFEKKRQMQKAYYLDQTITYSTREFLLRDKSMDKIIAKCKQNFIMKNSSLLQTMHMLQQEFIKYLNS